jgi:hypothetical protein
MRLVAALLGLLTLATGCASKISGQAVALDIVRLDRQMIIDYFERGNSAADEGADAQQKFFAETQHPDFESEVCDLGGHTLAFDPTLSTLRPDGRWRPDDDEAPRGRVYVVAVTITIQMDSAVLGTQIGSVHVVVLDDAAYGFAPCPG